jgi:hypothetical protein
MVGIGAVKVSTRSYSWQYWLAVKDRDSKGFFIKLTLPRDALLRAILNNQGSMHPAGLTLEVFSLALMGVDLPGRSASAT